MIIPSQIVHPGELTGLPSNSNTHPKQNIEELAESRRLFEQFKNLVTWSPPEEMQIEVDGETHTLKPSIKYVIAGNGFHQASLLRRDDSIEIKDYSHLSYDEALLLMETDNASPLGSVPNVVQMAANLERARGLVVDNERMKRMLERAKKLHGVNGKSQDAGKDTEPQIDKAEQLRQKWGVELGQLWQLAEHRVICGDCTDKAVVDRVMGGERTRMVFTDPPYGIGKDIENDNLKGSARVEFYRLWTSNALLYCIENAYIYVWGYFDTLTDYWQEVVKARGDCNFRNFIVWRKNFIQGRNAEDFRQFPEEYEACLLFIYGQPFQNGPWSTSPNAEHYPEMFEPLRAYLDGERQKMGWDIPTVKKMVGHSDLLRDHWFNKSQWSMPTREVYDALQVNANGSAFRREYDSLRREYDSLRREYDSLRGFFDNSNGFTDLWWFDKLTTTNLHPTVKPVEVCERGIKTTSQREEIVLDLFLGSGSTLLACHNLNRICRGIEIDPGYVGVCLQRFLDHTGIQPVLL